MPEFRCGNLAGTPVRTADRSDEYRRVVGPAGEKKTDHQRIFETGCTVHEVHCGLKGFLSKAAGLQGDIVRWLKGDARLINPPFSSTIKDYLT